MSGVAGEGCEVLIPYSERKTLQEIERNLITKNRKKIWRKFTRAIKEFQLIKEGDRVAVGVSGGKDSLLMAKLFQELQRHGQIGFEVEFIAMDPGYHPHIKKLLLDNCNYLEIPIRVFESQIFQIVDNIAQDYPCYMCAKMRRGALYAKTQELGCNKLALGHHYNDVIETVLLNLFYAGSFKTMLPKLKSQNFAGLELIRPLYYVEEAHIEQFIMGHGIWPLNCACMVSAKKTGNKRHEMKSLIAQLKQNIQEVDKSILRATKNVHLDAVLGWKKHKKAYSYLDFYDEEE